MSWRSMAAGEEEGAPSGEAWLAAIPYHGPFVLHMVARMPASPGRPWYILPVIVGAQFAGTSLWFAGNAVLPDLQAAYGLPEEALGHMTSAVQLGFIAGTFVYAFLLLADRFPPARVFLLSALLGAAFNVGVGSVVTGYTGILGFRFATGIFLAGIYPVGMKIASDWYEAGLGKALGYLVGALVLGTAFPHLLKFTAADVAWQRVMQGTSVLAVLGGGLLWALVPDGPFRTASRRFRAGAIAEVFRYPAFRSAAFGYFGHMWELYAFWAFVPVIVATRFPEMSAGAVSLAAFFAIAVGSVSCVLGGYWSLRYGSARVAAGMLAVSGTLCLASPVLFDLSALFFLVMVGLWGFAVIGDSPQFSTLVARTAPAEYRGSALTIVNSLGFAITIGSIQLLNVLVAHGGVQTIYLVLAIGPAAGLVAIRRLVRAGA